MHGCKASKGIVLSRFSVRGLDFISDVESTGAQRLLLFPVVSSQTSGSYDRLKRDRLSADPGRCEKQFQTPSFKTPPVTLNRGLHLSGAGRRKGSTAAVNDEGLGGYMEPGSVVASLNRSASVRL